MAVAAEVEEIIAKNALQYDLLPYESKPFPQSQPARLAAIAKIFGLKPAAVPTARVLELGCASGGNIIPLAMQYPAAEFVGVDLSRKQVAAGRTRAEKLGLKNFALHCKSLTELGDDIGQFDYIICHGVFSWVPRAVQDAIFAIARQRLKPIGVAYVSYNVLPGWRMMQPLRDAFLNMIGPSLDNSKRVAEAVDLARFLAEATPSAGAYGQVLKAWLERVHSLPVDYLAHEFLEDTNDPCSFGDFAQRASAHGLTYLGDTDIQTMLVQHYPANVADEILRRSGNNIVTSEQMMDLLSGRTFRQTLLVHQERAPEINRNLSPQCLGGLHLLGIADTSLHSEKDFTTLNVPGRQSFTITNAAMKKALEKFIASYPSSSEINDLAGKADLEAVKDGFYRLMLSGAVMPLSEPVKAASGAPKLPRAASLATRDAEQALTFTTNLRHETVTLDVASRFLLANMQGKKNQDELISSLVDEGRSGRIIFIKDGKQAQTPEESATFAKHHAPLLMSGLAKAALLVG